MQIQQKKTKSKLYLFIAYFVALASITKKRANIWPMPQRRKVCKTDLTNTFSQTGMLVCWCVGICVDVFACKGHDDNCAKKHFTK